MSGDCPSSINAPKKLILSFSYFIFVDILSMDFRTSKWLFSYHQRVELCQYICSHQHEAILVKMFCCSVVWLLD